jgi:DUF1009 family protein
MTAPPTPPPARAAPVEELVLIAGRGRYPLELARAARRQGVRRIVAVAFRRETDRALAALCDEVHWVHWGRFARVRDIIRASGLRHAVMAGQLTPTHLFSVRMDAETVAALARLRERNAHTLFGRAVEEVTSLGVEMLPAHRFMESAMVPPGLLTRRAPTAPETEDIALGFRVAKVTSGLDIGQTVVIKQGTVLAVEAFEGTDATIRRAGRLGGAGAVVVKVAKHGHDMRFDIPVVGPGTVRVLHRVRAAVLAVEARRAIVLDREAVVREADRLGLCVTAVEDPAGGAPAERAGQP